MISVFPILFWAMAVWLIFWMICSIAGSFIYDLKQLKINRRFSARYRGNFIKAPLISLIIPTHNEGLTIEAALKSITKSTYRKYEIIVVDNASSDETKQIVKNFIKAQPGLAIKLLSKRRNVGRRLALVSGFKTQAEGELILPLDADSMLHKNALKRVVRHFRVNNIDQLVLVQQIIPYPSLIGIGQLFENLILSYQSKLISLTRPTRLKSIRSHVYKRNAFMSKIPSSNVGYAADALIYTQPVINLVGLYSQRLRRQTAANSLLSPLLWLGLALLFGYLIYMALILKTPLLMALSWVVMATILLIIVWSQDNLSVKSKLLVTSYIPIAYILLVVTSLMRLVILISSLLIRVFKKTNLEVWQSPKRVTVV